MKDKMNMKVIGIGRMRINFVNLIKNVEYITIDTDSENSNTSSSRAQKKIFLDTGVPKCQRKHSF